jgi:hypothetical protein
MDVRVPNWESAVIPRAKIVDYLLSRSHRDGRHKEAFFSRLGFSTEDWDALVQALRKHVSDNDVTKVEPSPFGICYVVEGIMESPSGKKALVRSVWFVEEGEDVPRFVTGYPIRGRQRT